MVESTNKSLLNDINFRTALLESLDWDETQFNSLLLYLQENMKQDITPNELLNNLNDLYGDKTFELIKELFESAYIENGLYIKPKDDYEH